MNLDDLLPRVRPEVLHCPPDLMVQQLRDVIRDFCTFTRAWQHEVESESFVAQVADYDIEVPTDGYPIAIEHMEYDGAPVYFKTVAWLDRWLPNWRTREADDFSMFTQISPKVFLLTCIPLNNGTAGGVRYRVSLQPTEDAATVDDTLADEWVEVWTDGAKARLLAIPDKPWSNVARADKLEMRYRSGRGAARIRVQHSYGNAVEQWVGPRFA
jgi:hypothetical protein